MIAPWDEGTIDQTLLKAVETAVEQPLAIARFDGAAAYLLYYSGGFPLYSSFSGSERPVYVGSAKDAKRRLAEHRSSIRAVPSLSTDDFRVRLISTATHDAAAYAESRLISLLGPPWNMAELAGFGSKHQGLARAAFQAPSPWDTIHTGRPWARPPDGRRRRDLDRRARKLLDSARPADVR